MSTIYLEASLGVPAEQVWKQIKDIRAPQHLTNMVHTVEVTGDNERTCATSQGDIIEKIISVDDARRRIAYTATKSPFPITHHNAATVVSGDGDGDGDGCRLAWITDVEPQGMAEPLRAVLAAEFDVIVSRLAT